MLANLPFDFSKLIDEPEADTRARNNSVIWWQGSTTPVLNNDFVLDSAFEDHVPSGMRMDRFTDSYNELPIHVTLIENGALFGHEFFACDLTVPSHSPQRLYLCSVERITSNLDKIKPMTPKHGCVYLVGANAAHKNHFHWSFQCLPGILLLRQVARQRGLDYRIALPPLNEFRTRTLELAGISKSECITLRPRQCLSGVSLLYTNATSGDLAFQPSSKLVDLLDPLRAACQKLASPDLPQRFYVSRRDAPNKRPLENVDELATALARRGYSELVMSKMSIEDQVCVFSGASSIVAPHGAGLVNLMFAPPTARLIEIMPEHYLHACFFRIAQMRGMGYTQVLSRVMVERGRHNSMAVVDIDKVLLAVERSESLQQHRAA